MTTCVLLLTVVLFIVFLSFFLRPPAAQERQGAVLVLMSPSVTLTSHYQIQLVPGPSLLLKQRVPLSPSHTPSPSIHPILSLLPASPASIQPSRSMCVHHGDKAEQGRKSVTGYNLCCCSLSSCIALSLSSHCRCSIKLGKVRATVTCLDGERQDHHRLLQRTER